MRVISGIARGSKIETIDSLKTRPTLDRVKEALFNILQNDIKDSIVLDLFAGSGALGIESLSRGAKKAYFCDNNIDAIKVIKRNLEKTRLIDNAEVFFGDYTKLLNKIKEKIDIIFIDPPYKSDFGVKALKELINKELINENSIIVIETDEIDRDIKELNDVRGVTIIDERKYGRANLIFVKKRGNI